MATKDFYKDPTLKHGVDWRVISYRLFQDSTLDGVKVEGCGQWEYVLQSKIDGGWSSEYFCCINGERLPERPYKWEVAEAYAEENNKKVIDLSVPKWDYESLLGIPTVVSEFPNIDHNNG